MRVAQLLETSAASPRTQPRYIGKAMQVLVERDATRSSAQAMGKTDGNITVIWEKGTGDFRPGTLITKQILMPPLRLSMGSEIPLSWAVRIGDINNLTLWNNSVHLMVEMNIS